MTPQTNLRVIRPSRTVQRPGDIFAMQIPDGRHLFGRVVDVDLLGVRAPTPSACLVYIYAELRGSKAIDPEVLRPTNLLIPPAFTNKMGWSRGYFETIDSRSLSKDDLLKQHCFWDAMREKYIDEHQRVLPGSIKPCGEWSLKSYRRLDDLISDELGIARAPQ